MNITFRKEEPKDYDEIYSLIKTAFATARVSDGDEQDYAVGLRTSKGYLPELALVAEIDGKIVGHIMLTEIEILTTGNPIVILLLAPLSILPEYQSKGIGTLLVKESLSKAKELGYYAALLVGDPNYYQRFGFRAAAEFGVYSDSSIPPQNIMACQLQDYSYKNIAGTVIL